MKAILKRGRLILVPEGEDEVRDLATWKAECGGHVLQVHPTSSEGLALFDLGERADACREPLQVSSRVKDPAIKLISNFAHTPFVLDGREYASVEGFWQGLKFDLERDRRRVAALWGGAARAAGDEVRYGESLIYEGERVVVGTWEHWQLMRRACESKFSQCEEAREALLETRDRPLQHRMRRDSRTIPGAIMAEIWMQIRVKLRQVEPVAGDEDE